MRSKKKVTFATATGDDVWELEGITEEQLRTLPVSIPWAYAAVALGYRRYSAVRAVAMGTWPEDVPLTQVGRGKMALLSDVMRKVGVSQPEPAGAASPS